MQLTYTQAARGTGLLLLLAAVTQAIYTALYTTGADVPRQLLWGTEAILFVFMAAVAGSALVQTRGQHLAWSAITAAAVLNVVQVGVGLTMFGPFFEAAADVDGLTPTARAVVAFSFMVYNAAKMLLALALVGFALERLRSGAVVIRWAGAVTGLVAMLSNAASMTAGRDVFGELPLAGGSGVVATVLLAFFLLTLKDHASHTSP